MGAEPAIRLAQARTSGLGRASAPVAPPHPVIGPPADSAIAFPVLARVVALLDLGLLAAGFAVVSGLLSCPLAPGQAVVSLGLFLYAAAAALRAGEAYRLPSLARFAAAIRVAIPAVVAATACLAGIAWLLGAGLDLAAGWAWRTGVTGLAAIVIARVPLAVLLALWRATGRLTRHVAVVGANDYSRSFIQQVRDDPASGLSIVGVYDDRLKRVADTHADVPVQGNIGHLLADARQRRIDVIVVALPLTAGERIAQIRGQLSPTVADIFLTADTAGLRYDGRDFEALGRNGVIRVASRPLGDWDAAIKGAFDRICAGLLLVGLSPLLLVIAVMVRLDSPGPALFRQPRVGFNNRPFLVFKFRSMYAHLADLHADRQTTRGDHRVTRLGAFLRRSSLDELPQLLNVVRGEMSLVGPRPHAANTKAEDRLFDEVVADYALRHRIKPGITGWAQVNGWRGETARVEQIEQRVAHDLAYIENWSLLLDLKILFMTAFRGFGGRHAY